MSNHPSITPRRRRLLCALAVAAVLVPSVAGAQEDPGVTTTTTTVLPPDTTPGPDPTVVPGPSTTVPTSTTVAPDPVTDPEPEQPPVPDGAEIPERAETGAPAGDPVQGPAALAPIAGSGPVDTAAVRTAIVGRLAASADPLATARQIEAETLAELVRSDRELASARVAHDEADRRRREAAGVVAAADAAADDARATAADAADQLHEVAVAMYLDPPAELAVAAALSGRTDERLAAESLLAAQSDLSRRSASRATRTERAADAAVARARDAARDATDAAVAAEDRLAQLEQEVARRAEMLARVATVVQTLRLEVGGLGGVGSRLADLVSIEQVTSSGSVVITVEPDGTWSIMPVGFPPASEILRIPGTTIRVHRLIAEQVQALVMAAAADGVRLDGWGYRDSVRQVELRRAHCGSSVDVVVHAPSSSCRPPTARPGRSMHERGLAVDFASCSTRSSPCYRWLSVNAARFGLLNLPSEPWHWSTNGN